jgi:hypothetical protein
MDAADQHDALAGPRALGDRHRHVPVLSGRRLHALEIKAVLLAGREVADVERADDLLSLDDVAGIDRARRRAGGCRGILRPRRHDSRGEGRRSADRCDGCDHEVAAIEASFGSG